MSIQVVPYDPTWPAQFRTIATSLCAALTGVPILSIEHVGSTSVPNLAAKPIIDVDIIVARPNAGAAIAALQKAGYAHQGNLGLVDRDSFAAPPASTSPRASPNANIYLCVEGTVHLRNHLAVREALRSRLDLRDEYAHVKRQLTAVPGMHIDRYLAGKSGVLAKVLDLSDLTEEEKRLVRKINDPDARWGFGRWLVVGLDYGIANVILLSAIGPEMHAAPKPNPEDRDPGRSSLLSLFAKPTGRTFLISTELRFTNFLGRDQSPSKWLKLETTAWYDQPDWTKQLVSMPASDFRAPFILSVKDAFYTFYGVRHDDSETKIEENIRFRWADEWRQEVGHEVYQLSTVE